ncbi:hypothetical protein NQ317_010486 [Molorchus minor]|uniref:Uncharacterized protein n=1 Tax=Molorchus minor TaxID=1323400 RepID=A0ABQ9K1C0_9CUCU|nr:hypothetical protein NQ317_010486 [Molorchus minor]
MDVLDVTQLSMNYGAQKFPAWTGFFSIDPNMFYVSCFIDSRQDIDRTLKVLSYQSRGPIDFHGIDYTKYNLYTIDSYIRKGRPIFMAKTSGNDIISIKKQYDSRKIGLKTKLLNNVKN